MTADTTLAALVLDAVERDQELRDRLAAALAPALTNGRVDDGWLRGAEAIADYLGAPRSRVYALASAGRIPVEHDGSALVARRCELDAWVRKGGARRP